MELREAQQGDAEGIAKVHIDSWRYAYKGIISDDILSALDLRKKIEVWKSLLSDSNWSSYVAINEKNLIMGFVTLCGCRDDDLRGQNVGEISSIYIDPSLLGAGVGALLFAKGIEHLENAGHRKIVLWVLEKNKRAISFYKSFDFHADGGIKTHSKPELNELRYVLNELNT